MRRADMMLNDEEQRLLNSFERGEWISKPDMAARKALLEKAAGAHLAKQVNVAILENDLAIIGRKAQSAGIPWQVFISRILHRYAQGNLIERNP